MSSTNFLRPLYSEICYIGKFQNQPHSCQVAKSNFLCTEARAFFVFQKNVNLLKSIKQILCRKNRSDPFQAWTIFGNIFQILKHYCCVYTPTSVPHSLVRRKSWQWMLRATPNVINKFVHSVTTLCWNKTIWLDLASDVTSFNQSEWFITAQQRYLCITKFVCVIRS